MKGLAKNTKIIQSAESVYIYGAGDVAREVAWCLMNKPYEIRIEAFVVSGNPGIESLFSYPVVSIDELAAKPDALFVIAVQEKFRDEICETLRAHGYDNMLCLTFESDLWAAVRRRGFEEYIKNSDYYGLKYLKDEIDVEEKRYKKEDDS